MLERINDEVYYLRGEGRVVDASVLDLLEEAGRRAPRFRCRVCTHASPESALHEMFIAHGREVHVPPHAHRDRAESFTVVRGLVSVFLFDPAGAVTRAIPMGPAGSGRALSVWIPAGQFHAQVFESEVVLFHEVTSGPFNPAGMCRAAFGPADDDLTVQAAYRETLMAHVGGSAGMGL